MFCGPRLRSRAPRARARPRPRPLGFVRPLKQVAEVASNDAPDFPGARVVRYTYVSDPLKATKSRVRGRGGVSIRFPGEPSALQKRPLLPRKEATFSRRSPRKSVDRYGPMVTKTLEGARSVGAVKRYELV